MVYGINKKSKIKLFRTSKNESHRHTWKKGNKFTSFNKGHKHRVSNGIALPSKFKGHKHKILKN